MAIRAPQLVIRTIAWSPPLAPQTMVANSWGFRDQSADKYIATSAALWKNGAHAPVLIDYETMRLGELLNQVSGQNVPNIGRYVLADANGSTMTVLAALAHEFGHAYWYDAFVVKSDGSPYPGGPGNFTIFCNGKFYLGAGGHGSWAMPVTFSQNSPRWIEFGEIRNSHQSDDVSISELISNLRSGNYDVAGNHLHGAFSGDQPNGVHNRYRGPWASRWRHCLLTKTLSRAINCTLSHKQLQS